jgi:hypothetical protein
MGERVTPGLTEKKRGGQNKTRSGNMASNHTMLTIAAFVILTTILQNFYRLLGNTGDDIGDAQDMILATTISTSYLELAQGLAFDAVTDSSDVALNNVSALTAPLSLGPEGAGEDSIQNFNDFDDFNGLTVSKQATGSNHVFRTHFTVSYVNPAHMDQSVSYRTFVKRIDLKVWRTFPPIHGTLADTLRTSVVQGYFHFD